MGHDQDEMPAWLDEMPMVIDEGEIEQRHAPIGAVVVDRGETTRANLPRPMSEVERLLVKDQKRVKDGWVEVGFSKNSLNVRLILENDPRWLGRIAYDSWQQEIVVDLEDEWHPLDSWVVGHIRQWIAAAYRLQVRREDIEEAIELVSRTADLNEVRSYLEGLEWDRVPRVDGLWVDYFGVEADHPLASVYSRRFMVQAVARALTPGCEAHGMAILAGAQGKGKTRGIHALAGALSNGTRLGVDLPMDRAVTDKDSLMALAMGWIINVDELEAFSRSSIAAVKGWLTAPNDTYRRPYAKRSKTYARHSVLVGSSNMLSFLHDSTGSRRFWVMGVASDRKVDVDAITRDRDQLWAEAMHLFRGGEQWHLTDEETAVQAGLNVRWEDEGWREDEIGGLVEGATVTTVGHIVAELNRTRPVGDDAKAAGRVKAYLQRNGWTYSGAHKRRVNGVVTRYWSMTND